MKNFNQVNNFNTKQVEFLNTVAENIYTYFLLYGGRRSSKTFILLHLIIQRCLAKDAKDRPVASRHLVLRNIFQDCKISVWYDSFPKVLQTAFPGLMERIYFNNSDMFCRFPNGSEIWFGGFGGTEKENRIEKVLGREYSSIFFNECSQMSYNAVIMALGSLAENVGLKKLALFDCNPPKTAHFSYKLWFEGVEPGTKAKIDSSQYYKMQMNPIDNVENIGQAYIENILMRMPERYKKRFLHGQYDDDNPNALWLREWIDKNRSYKIPDLQRIVVALDPPATSGEESAEAGIVVVGQYTDPNGKTFYYVLDDLSQRGSPLEWSSAAVAAYHKYKADCIIAERNNGGEMVESVIKNTSDVPVRLVWASRGKVTRAEPVSALYEEGRVHHVGVFTALEDQLCDWSPSDPGAKSPDRLDALVWGISSFTDSAKVCDMAELSLGDLPELGDLM